MGKALYDAMNPVLLAKAEMEDVEYSTQRTATFTVVTTLALGATQADIDAADYRASDYANGVLAIQAAIDAVNATGYRGSVQLIGGAFTGTTTLSAKSKVDVLGPADITVTNESSEAALDVDGVTNAIWKDVTIRRAGTTGDKRCIVIHGAATDNTFKMVGCKGYNEIVGAAGSCWGIRIYEGSPLLEDCEGYGSDTAGGSPHGIAITGGSPTLINSRGYGGDTSTGGVGINIQGTPTTTMKGCIGTGGQGAASNTSYGIFVESTNLTIMQDCTGIGGGTGAAKNAVGIIFGGTGQIDASNCVGRGGAGTAEDNVGVMFFNSNPLSSFSMLVGIGGQNSSPGANGILVMEGNSSATGTGWTGISAGASAGIGFRERSSMQISGCIGKGGSGTGDGLEFYDACSPIVTGCIGMGGSGATGSGIWVAGAAGPVLNGCIGMPATFAYKWSYDDANSGRFRPVDSLPYLLTGIFVQVNVAHAGETLDLGTSAAGSQIANDISINATGSQFIDFVRVEVASDGYLYATPSAAISDGDVDIYCTVVSNNATCHGLILATTGFARLTDCVFIGNGASHGCEIQSPANTVKNWAMIRCHFETMDVVNQYALNSAAILLAPIYECTAIGPVNGVTTYAASIKIGS